MNDQPRTDKPWTERISRSGYFVGAVLVHLVIFVLVATWVVFPARQQPNDEPPKTFTVDPQPSRPTTPPNATVVKVEVPNDAPQREEPIVPTTSGSHDFSIDVPTLGTATTPSTPNFNPAPTPKIPQTGISSQRIPGIISMLDHMGRSPRDIAAEGDDPKNIAHAKFPVYLASYANGDWNCNVHLTDGKIDAGSLPDLTAKITEWSHGRIKAEMVPTPLNISGTDLMDKMPPFIFFTGHKDFILTDVEIQNLREYLNIGGAIWGDNALAGRGSRFDVAFRREMKRLIPNEDFAPVQANDKLFTKWFVLPQVPKGMNYYSEPIEHMDIEGKLAILYTPNDYSDLFSMHILPDDTTIGGTERDLKSDSPLFTNGTFLRNRGIFFRNFELSSCLACDRLGMNVIGYLLVRFNDDLLLSRP